MCAYGCCAQYLCCSASSGTFDPPALWRFGYIGSSAGFRALIRRRASSYYVIKAFSLQPIWVLLNAFLVRARNEQSLFHTPILALILFAHVKAFQFLFVLNRSQRETSC